MGERGIWVRDRFCLNSIKPFTAIITHYGTGGALLYLRELGGTLGKMGFPAVYYLPEGTALKTSECSMLRFILKEASVSPPSLRLKTLKYAFHIVKYLFNTIAVKPERGIKVAHLLFPFYITDILLIKRLKRKGIKIILTVHEVFPHKPFLGGKIDFNIMKMMYEKADLLLTHTETLKSELVERYNVGQERVVVIPHGYFEYPENTLSVDSLRLKYYLPSDKKVLLFFGSIRQNKGLDILLKAMRGLTSDFFLLITGQSAGASELPEEYYRELILTYGISDSVHWVNKYISEDEASEVFKIADAVILPYKRTFHAQSGVLNLAIGYEKPCVVSDVGGIGETVRNYGLGVVVEPESSEDLMRGIKRLFNNAQSYGFKRYKEENSWDRVAGLLIEKYKKMAVGDLK